MFLHFGVAAAATAACVLVSPLKINVTNAYAGPLAWSNFFSRLTHAHPGRQVWMVFNTAIALVLTEMNVFQALSNVLGLCANVAIAWMMAVVADLVVNTPLGPSPQGIEFKHAHLYDINPVGMGAMGIASVLSVAAHLGGPSARWCRPFRPSSRSSPPSSPHRWSPGPRRAATTWRGARSGSTCRAGTGG